MKCHPSRVHLVIVVLFLLYIYVVMTYKLKVQLRCILIDIGLSTFDVIFNALTLSGW